MADAMDRLKDTQAQHRILRECAAAVESVVHRLDAVYMEKLADEIADIPALIRNAEQQIAGNAAEDVNDQIRHSETMVANTMLALLKAPQIPRNK